MKVVNQKMIEEINRKLYKTYSFIKESNGELYLSIADFVSPDILCEYDENDYDIIIYTLSYDDHFILKLNTEYNIENNWFESSSKNFSDKFYHMLLDNEIQIDSKYYKKYQTRINRTWIIRNILKFDNEV